MLKQSAEMNMLGAISLVIIVLLSITVRDSRQLTDGYQEQATKAIAIAEACMRELTEG